MTDKSSKMYEIMYEMLVKVTALERAIQNSDLKSEYQAALKDVKSSPDSKFLKDYLQSPD